MGLNIQIGARKSWQVHPTQLKGRWCHGFALKTTNGDWRTGLCSLSAVGALPCTICYYLLWLDWATT
jgi:hypothetical protein